MTDPPPRNALCPCGSGRKYKRCCWRKDSILRLAYADRERQSAFAKLLGFGNRQFDGHVRDARSLFWGGRLDLVALEKRRELEADETSIAAFLNWFLLDYSPDFSEETIADRFLARPEPALTAGERTYLERMGASCLRPYEITAVKLDESMTLRDLWTGDVVQVRERLGTHQLVQWDVLAARVIEGPSGGGVLVFDGVPYPYPGSAKSALLSELRARHHRLKGEIPAADDVRFFKRVGMVFHQLWLDHNVLRPMPAIVTAEGDPVVFTKTVFDVADDSRVEEALGAHPAFERSGDEYVWVDHSGNTNRLLGNLRVHGGRLIMEATSESRALRGRRLLEELLGDAVKFRAMSEQGLESALADAPRRASAAEPEVPEVPPELQQEIVGSLYERHYRDWLDEPVPALGGRTPRHAARLKTFRPAVVDLIKGIENQMERARLNGEPAIEVSWMWEELGLERS